MIALAGAGCSVDASLVRPGPEGVGSFLTLFSGNALMVGYVEVVVLRSRALSSCQTLVVLVCERGVFVAVVLAQILLISQFFAVWCFCDSLIVLRGGTA